MVRIFITLILLFNLSLVFCYTVSVVNDFVDSSEKNGSDRLEIGIVDWLKIENSEFEIKEVDLNDDDEVSVSDENGNVGVNNKGRAVNYALEKIGQKYYCFANTSEESYLLMYGTKTWKFPRQTVNLTLTYPSDKEQSNNKPYLITAFEVIVCVDGGRSRAYLTSGDLMQDTVSLFVVSEEISYLSFQFKVYGISKAAFFNEGPFYYHCG